MLILYCYDVILKILSLLSFMATDEGEPNIAMVGDNEHFYWATKSMH